MSSRPQGSQPVPEVQASGEPSAETGTAPRPIPWDLIGQVIGVVSGLAAWVGVVGGARIWARLESLDLPAYPTLTSLDPSAFVIEGLQTLLFPVLLGGLLSLVLFFSRPQETANPDAAGDERGTSESTAAVSTSSTSSTAAAENARAQKSPTTAASGDLITGDTPRIPDDGPSDLRVKTREEEGSATSEGSPTEAPRTAAEAGARWTTRLRDWLARRRPVANVRGWAGRDRGYALGTAIGLGVLLPLVTLYIADVNPYLVGGAALVGFATMLFGISRSEPRRRPWFVGTGAVIIALGIFIPLWIAVEFGQLGVMLAVTAIALWVTLGAIDNTRPGRSALILFIAVVAWSGALGYAQELGDRTPDLSAAKVQLKDGREIPGYYLGRSATHLHIAAPLKDRTPPTYVVALPFSDIASYAYGRIAEVPARIAKQPGRGLDKQARPTDAPTPPAPTFTPVPAPTETTNPPTPSPEPEPEPDVEVIPPPRPDPRDEAEAIATKDATLGTQPAQLQVLSLVKRPDSYLALEVRLWNSSSDRLALDSRFGRGAGDDSFSGVHVVDPANDMTYGVAYSDDGCVCERDLDQVVVPAQGWRYLSAEFLVTEPLSPTVDLRVPGFGWIHGVPVS